MNDVGKTKVTSFMDEMSPEDARRYEQWNKYVEAGISPSDRVRVLEISEKAPKPEYMPDTYTQQEVLDIKPNADEGIFRPDVEDYLSSDYIEAHRRQFDNGAARFQKIYSETYNNGVIGVEGGDNTSFWLSKDHADIIQEVANGNNRIYEALLGFDPGYLGDEPLYRIDVAPEIVEKRGLSIPSGNEIGANDWWRPGGRTYPGDMPEGVMKDVGIEEGDYTWKKVD
ncbi:TPA: hypothetical protein TZ704_002175 [Streptococcus suis]|nr:hypothetical protein [Streptococcus suis]